MFITSNLTDRETLSLTDSLPTERISSLLEENESFQLELDHLQYLADQQADKIEELKEEIEQLREHLSRFHLEDYTISDHLLCALINDDWTGLDDDEEKQLRLFLTHLPSNGHWSVPDDESSFARCEVLNLMSSCLTVQYLHPKK